jgi:tRNA U34 5-methylaminomethyl-2-thiouridine-forming methyltransferase MnmC
VHGAIQESNHVFIHHGFNYFHSVNSTKKIRILEVGFGTGLNAWLTMKACQSFDVQVDYTALEPFPLEEEIFNALNYGGSDFLALHLSKWEQPISLSSNFSLTKIKQPIQQQDFPPGSFDIVYYDAFAPNTQPEMWSQEIFQRIKTMMDNSSVFVTYSAKGQVKRDLKSAGFVVESLPGPPGKREMVRAILVPEKILQS